jgi:hypothetical protein
MPDKWQDRPRLLKPYTIEQVEDALSVVLNGSSARPA